MQRTERLRAKGGFTILELTVVLAIAVLLIGFAGWTFSAYVHRTAAQRAAQVFARDLTLARSAAVRSREAVVIRFFETGRWYQVSAARTNTEIVRRRFAADADLNLAEIDLVITGDTLVFDNRGIADLGGSGGTLGEARFSSGGTRYSVFFNSMGTSRVEES